MHRRFAVVALAALVGLVVSTGACGSAQQDTTHTQVATSLDYGAVASVAVDLAAGAELSEPVSGLRFGFPTGGKGSLHVAALTSFPPAPIVGGDGYVVRYTGSEEIELVVAHGVDSQVEVLRWGPLYGATAGGGAAGADKGWFFVPPKQRGDAADRFTLPVNDSGSVPLEVGGGTLDLADQALLVRVRAGNAAALAQEAAIRALLQAKIDALVALLPAALQEQAAERRAALPSTVHFYDAEADPEADAMYVGFARHSFLGVLELYASLRPHFVFHRDSSAASVAHEAGHYVTHLLVGETAYLALENQTATYGSKHGLADAHPSRPMLEEYAHFAQWCTEGKVAGLDASSALQLSLTQSPADHDFPSLEGFAVLLLVQLSSGSSTLVAAASHKSEPAPPVGLAIADLWAVLAKGPADVHALRSGLAAAVGSAGLPALSVVAERAGWSLHGKGRLRDTAGKPVVGAKVEVVREVGGTSYGMRPDDTATSDGDGRFLVPRLFPGKSTLRVTTATGEVNELDVPVAWTAPTNEQQDLGDLVVGQRMKCFALVAVASHAVSNSGGGHDLCTSGCTLYDGSIDEAFLGELNGLAFHAEELWCKPAPAYCFGDPANWQQLAVTMDLTFGPKAAWVEKLTLAIVSQTKPDSPVTTRGLTVLEQIPRKAGASGFAEWMQFELEGPSICDKAEVVAPWTYKDVVCDDASRIFVDCQVVNGP